MLILQDLDRIILGNYDANGFLFYFIKDILNAH